MTYSVLFRHHHRTFAIPIGAVNAVNGCIGEPAHPGVRQAHSPWSFSKHHPAQQLLAVAPAENRGRRVGASAGATPVFAGVVRHDTLLVRQGSLRGRSHTCPSHLTRNLMRFAFETNSTSEE